MKINTPLIYDKIKLRDIIIEDVTDEYVIWLNNPEVNKYLEARFTSWTKSLIRDFVRDSINDESTALLAIENDSKHIGNFKIEITNTRHNIAAFSLFIGEKTSWGKKIASTAISIAADYTFDVLKMDKITASMYQENVASLKSFLRAGFSIEGVWKDHCSFDGINKADVLQVGLSRKDWEISKIGLS